MRKFQLKRNLVWWLCVEYLPQRDRYAIGVVLVSKEGVKICCLVDFTSAILYTII